MRELEMTGKTVEEAIEAACAALGVDRDDLNVAYEVLEMPAKKLFKTIPARVKVTVTEDDIAAPVAPVAPVAPAKEEPAAPAPKAAEPDNKKAEKPAPAEKSSAKANAAMEEVPLTIEGDERLTAAVEYLTPIFALMGAENVTITAVKKGEATILKVDGDKLGALIGRRGETMESLSYLASLVVNRLEGDYMKLGLDVSGYRGKREQELCNLTARLCERVKNSGYSYEMEPMNPYERHIIHSAVGDIEGVRSESKGEGQDRRVVIYSTDPNASNQPDRESAGLRGRGRGGRGPRNDRGPRGPRFGHGPQRSGGGYGNRGPRSDRGDRGSYGSRPPRSNVPEREFAEVQRPQDAQPGVPSRTERIHDDDFDLFGKIEL